VTSLSESEPQIFRQKTTTFPVKFKVKVTPSHAIRGTEGE